jgi:hypothetical protein
MGSKRGNPVKHIGFHAAAEKAAAGEGEDLQHGEAIIAASNRKASKSARAKNPRLNKTSGMSGY